MNSQIRLMVEPWEDLNDFELVFVAYASDVGFNNE